MSRRNGRAGVPRCLHWPGSFACWFCRLSWGIEIMTEFDRSPDGLAFSAAVRAA
jgi:hypothetical protein